MAGRLLSRHVRSLNACIGSPQRVTITQIRHATYNANHRDPVVSERPDNLGGLGSTEKEHVRCESGTEEENSLRGGFPSAPDGESRRPRKSQQNGGERKNLIYQQQGSGHSSQPHDGQHKQIDTPQDVHHFLQLAERDLAGPAEATALLKSSMEAIQSLPRKDQQAVQDWIQIWCMDESLRDGAAMKPKTEHIRSALAQRSFNWPAELLAATARAKLYWSEDGTVDAALDFILNRSRYGRGLLWYDYAATVLAKALCKDQTRPCNPVLFGKFLDDSRRRRLRSNSDETTTVHLSVAELYFYHPTEADARLMLAICRNKSALQLMLGYIELRRRSFALRALRAAYLLRLQGDQHNANYMRDVSVQLHERPWSMRARLYEIWTRDPKLKRRHEESPFTDAEWRDIMEGSQH
ncbi:hypothetical protein CKM354_000150600 [Cercospora kikuchii]|uniref:Uncharacterized protein n=1 Tax=Cercospora kikuchii TaxID=84275 RepID=A0A9P3CDM4_9PEZI|nr:uncharacterized protein CKM354_000150600 [Cercospora kikuchii]GIZ38080.1 hypothetical protein CKM354_000150600 [Cercospora kikuchii]